MKIRVLSCLLAGVLSLSLLLGACSQKPGETKKGPAVTLSDKEVVTMEKAADYLSYTAADYNKEVPGKKELLTMASRLLENCQSLSATMPAWLLLMWIYPASHSGPWMILRNSKKREFLFKMTWASLPSLWKTERMERWRTRRQGIPVRTAMPSANWTA